MQAAGEAVGTALALVKLATGMQPGEHQLDDRGFFFGVHAKGNAASIVFDADGAIGKQGNTDLFAKPRQSLIGGVVDHLLDDVQGVVGPGVHARALLDGLQPFEDPDGTFGVVGLFGGHGRRL